MEEKELKSFDVVRWVIEDEEAELNKKVSKKKINDIKAVCDAADAMGKKLGAESTSASFNTLHQFVIELEFNGDVATDCIKAKEFSEISKYAPCVTDRSGDKTIFRIVFLNDLFK